MKRFVLAAMSACILSCRAVANPTPSDTIDIEPLAQEVAYLRRLAPKRPLRIEWLSPGEWRDSTHPNAASKSETMSAWIAAFSLLPPGLDSAKAGSDARDGIEAMYDLERKTIVAPRGVKSFDPRSLAHEIAHALVDQYFGIPRQSGKQSDDERTAAHAFVEGDAAATETMWWARTWIGSPSAALADTVKQTNAPPSKRVAAEIAMLPPYVRDDIAFDYIDGLRFVEALHRTGGFALVDRAWKRPPWTTEQVLHPEKYLAGEGGIPVANVPPPANATSIHEDTGGELGLRMVLETCFGDEGAELATGWGGDRYRISRLPDGRLALQWAIVWDDAPRAEHFEKVAAKLSTCWSDALARDEARNLTNRVAPGLKIARSGAKVAVVRGLGDQPDVDALFASIGAAPPPVPPVSTRELAPELEVTEPEATLVGRRFDVTPFGFVLDVPAALNAKRVGSTGLSVHDPGDFLELSVDVIPTTEVEKRIASYVQRIETDWGSVKLMDGGKGAIETSMGGAIERRWYVGGSLARVVVVPLCGGMRSLIVRAHFLADDARTAEYQTLLASFKRTKEDPPPACR